MQVPPRWRRSTIATRRPAPARRTASDGPACPPPMTTSSKASAVMPGPRPPARARSRPRPRSAPPAGRSRRPRPSGRAARRRRGCRRPRRPRRGRGRGRVAPAAAPSAAPQKAPETMRPPNCTGTLRLGVVGQLVGDELDQREERRRARTAQSEPMKLAQVGARSIQPSRAAQATAAGRHHRAGARHDADQKRRQECHGPSPARGSTPPPVARDCPRRRGRASSVSTAHQADDLVGAGQDRLGDGRGLLGALAEQPVDLGRVGGQLGDPAGDRRELAHREIGEPRLELGEVPARRTRPAPRRRRCRRARRRC